jgi:beta-1,4-mannosyltransferase
VSSTSWTEDEDFDMLLNALLSVNETLSSLSELPIATNNRLVVVITGKGPKKTGFVEKIRDLEEKKKLTVVSIRCVWLESQGKLSITTTSDPFKIHFKLCVTLRFIDYPLLLSCADLGVSMHTSTSGLDLPMKVQISVTTRQRLSIFVVIKTKF